MQSMSNTVVQPSATHTNIRVAPAVLEAARKDGTVLLRDLQTSLAGLTQAQAEERARIGSERDRPGAQARLADPAP